MRYTRPILRLAMLIACQVAATQCLAAGGAEKSAALFEAVRADNLERVQAALADGANPDARDDRGFTPLHYAVGCPVAIPKALLAAGAKANVSAADGMTPLHFAASLGEIECAGLLLEHGADLKARNESGSTPLHEASASAGNTKMVKFLLGKGALVNARDDDGSTPLTYALRKNRTTTANLLIENGGRK